MFTRNAFFIALAALCVVPLAAQEHPRGPGMGQHGEAGPGMLMRGLDLTETQKASLKALATKYREATKSKQELAMTAMKAFHTAMMDPAMSVEQLKVLHEKASQAQFEVALDRRAMMQESMALLTPEQKAKAEKLRAERPKGAHKGMPERGEGRRHGLPPQGSAPEMK